MLLLCVLPPPSPSPLVIDEGNGWLAACKPAGISVHEGSDSLVRALADAGHPNLSPVHRIDAGTTGVCLMAKDGAAATLQKALESATKQYIGVLRGELHEASGGEWSAPLTRRAEGRKNPQGSPASARVPALTRYRCIAAHANEHMSLVELTISTGRTHQIRRHAAMARHAVVGDGRYGEARHGKHVQKRFGCDGIMLHASRLVISIDGDEHSFHAPLPPDWERLLMPLGWMADAADV